MMMEFSLLFLTIFLFLGILSQNMALIISILVLMLLKVTPLSPCFSFIQKNGTNIGIIILTISVLVPIASGSMTTSAILHSFKDWHSLIAILVGICVSWLGGRGVNVMVTYPNIVSGLLIGTVTGVAFFRGVPVGPLIAAGLVSLFVG